MKNFSILATLYGLQAKTKWMGKTSGSLAAASAMFVVETLIGAMIAIVVGLYLLPTVLSTTSAVTTNATDKSQFSGVVGLTSVIPIIYVVIILVASLTFIVWRGRD